ncbi:MAG: hypothetical protein WC384_03295 [Prolixibacteraceae bacterium]|jgi:hypothetical protein
MQTHADKTGETKNQSAPAVTRKKNNADSAYSFSDNRPETLVQRKLQDMANTSFQLKQVSPVQLFMTNPSGGSVVQLKGKYKQFGIATKAGLLIWIDGDKGWEQDELLAVLRDWNAEKDDKIAFAELDGTNAEGFIEENDIAFQQVTEKDEDPAELPEDAVAAPQVPPKPKNYQVVREGWDNSQAMNDHCYTYCGPSQMTLVLAAQKLGLEPPMLGHGSDSGVGGTAKDATLWKQFQEYMEWYFAAQGLPGRSTNDIAKKVLKK